ncbi:MAG: SAM-dependent chlorinase/fluorinase [Nitrospiraceae bacterium]|nr:MAG: SAM-dependent chlorinase/fluorinase [Nitrospiraceae bacterium]
MLNTPIITLTSDFGLKDSFAGLMKGVILGINPDAKIVDITHNIHRHNIFEAAQVLSMSYRYFPPTTIHIAVVDPGVGSNRRPLLVVTEDHYFIGPDNGIFTAIFESQKSNFFKVYHLTASHYFLPMRGLTFHGRDIFAPAAAWLSKGVDSHKMGDPVTDYVTVELPMPLISPGNVTGQIVSIDAFGNAISNIRLENLEPLGGIDAKDRFAVTYQNERLPFVSYYAENSTGGLSAIINSFGQLELYVYQRSAAEERKISIGDPVSVQTISG